MAGPKSFGRSDRIRKSWEFRVFREAGARTHTPHFLIVLSLPTTPNHPSPRLGITVSKKVSKKAVQRNRVKRLVREAFRQNRSLFPKGCDVLVVARPGAEALHLNAVCKEFQAARTSMRGAARKLTTRRSEGDVA